MKLMNLKTLTVLFLSLFVIVGCKPSPEPIENPITDIKKTYDDKKSYSLILKNMKVDDDKNLFYHRYELVGTDHGKTFRKDLGWKKVPYDLYKNHKSDLNTTILSKKGDDIRTTPHPPGYQYVGNEKYGRWKENDDGSQFWEFYGKYAMFQNVMYTFGSNSHRPRYGDYRSYRRHVSNGKPYYSNGRYGTSGKYTKRNHTGKYRNVRSNNRTFSSSSWGGRSRSTARGRSGGFGK